MAYPYAVSCSTAVRLMLPQLAVSAALLFLSALPTVTAHGAPPPASAPAAPGPAAGTPRPTVKIAPAGRDLFQFLAKHDACA